MNLTNDQRGQLRKDLIDLQHANTQLQKSAIAPGHIKQLVALQARIIDTLAIHAGAYEKTGE